MPIPTPFYLDWPFWTALTAIVTLVWTQFFPPLRQLLKGARLRVEMFSMAVISHDIGNPRFDLHLILSNVGGRDLRVVSMSLHLAREGEEFTIPSTSYYEGKKDNAPVLLTPFRLKRDDEWSHSVLFLARPKREDQKKIKAWQGGLRDDIVAKRAELPDKHPLVEGYEGFWQPLAGYARASFKWHPGEYVATITVATEPPSATQKKRIRFTIFESDSQMILGNIDEYKYGFGVILPTHDDRRYVHVPIESRD